jgi:hypothetical protein
MSPKQELNSFNPAPSIHEQIKLAFGSEVLVSQHTTPYFKATYTLPDGQEVDTVAFPTGFHHKNTPPFLPDPQHTPRSIENGLEYNVAIIGSAFHFSLILHKNIDPTDPNINKQMIRDGQIKRQTITLRELTERMNLPENHIEELGEVINLDETTTKVGPSLKEIIATREQKRIKETAIKLPTALADIRENPHFQRIGSMQLSFDHQEFSIQEICHRPNNEAILKKLAKLFPYNPPPNIPTETQPYYLDTTTLHYNPKKRPPFTIAFPVGEIHKIELPQNTPYILQKLYNKAHKTIWLQPSPHHPPIKLQVIEIADVKKAGQMAVAVRDCSQFNLIGHIFNQGGVRLISHRPNTPQEDALLSLDSTAILEPWQKKSPHQNQSNNFQRLLSNK